MIWYPMVTDGAVSSMVKLVPVTVPRGLPASSDPARVTVTWPFPLRTVCE